MNQKRFSMFPVKSARKNFIIERVLFVDPGLDGFGWAFFNVINCRGIAKAGKVDSFKDPTATGQYIPKGKTWETKAADSWAWFAGIVAQVEPKEIVIEFPEYWTGVAVSHAATVKGDLFKLSFQIGGFAQVAISLGTNEPIFIEPRIWKGQLPKEIMLNRLKDLAVLPGQKLGSHQADAIGMGMSAQGVL